MTLRGQVYDLNIKMLRFIQGSSWEASVCREPLQVEPGLRVNGNVPASPEL